MCLWAWRAFRESQISFKFIFVFWPVVQVKVRGPPLGPTSSPAGRERLGSASRGPGAEIPGTLPSCSSCSEGPGPTAPPHPGSAAKSGPCAPGAACGKLGRGWEMGVPPQPCLPPPADPAHRGPFVEVTPSRPKAPGRRERRTHCFPGKVCNEGPQPRLARK